MYVYLNKDEIHYVLIIRFLVSMIILRYCLFVIPPYFFISGVGQGG